MMRREIFEGVEGLPIVNISDIEFGYTEVKRNFSSPLDNQSKRKSSILPPSFNQNTGERTMCQIATQPCITTIKRLTPQRRVKLVLLANKFICSFDPNFFLRGGFTKNELKKKIKVPVYLLY